MWYLARLTAPGMDVTGATAPGMPFTMVGRNDRIAWGITTAGGDVADPETNPKFAHKLHFMSEMANWWTARKDPARKAILAGEQRL